MDFAYHRLFLERNPRKKLGFTVLHLLDVFQV